MSRAAVSKHVCSIRSDNPLTAVVPGEMVKSAYLLRPVPSLTTKDTKDTKDDPGSR